MILLASSTEPAFRVLVSRRHVVHRDSTTRAYRVECFLSLPLDPLVTLSSSYFTRGKIVSECNVTFERYRTKWPLVFPTPDQKAECIAYLLVEEIVPTFGVPEALIRPRDKPVIILNEGYL